MKKLFLFLGISALLWSGNLENLLKETPLYFVKNRGQVNPQVFYYSKASFYTLWLTKDSMVFAVKTNKGWKKLSLTFEGASYSVKLEAAQKSTFYVNYFKGNGPVHWYKRIPTYLRVCYKGLYRGIDLCIYGKEKLLEYDWIVHPGADLRKIRMKFHGGNTRLDVDGNIVMEGNFGQIVHRKPLAFQGKRKVKASFVKRGKEVYGVLAQNYDRTKPLVIDPIVLIFSTYLGGSQYDDVRGITVDDRGNVYVVGATESPDFPLRNPYQNFMGYVDAYLTKIGPDGNLIYSTYLGGNDCDWAGPVALDSSGNIYVAGATWSSDFPTKDPFQENLAGRSDVFLVKFSPDGTSLLYSTYLGGNDWDLPESLALDASENIYIAGRTYSTDFPTKNPLQASLGGEEDAFVTKFTPDGSSLVYSTYLGGSARDLPRSIAVDSAGHVYVAGITLSLDFPTKNPLQASLGGEEDAFVTKFTPDGSSLVYSTYLGGNEMDYATSVDIDSAGNAYLTGVTYSYNFPIKNPLQGDLVGESDAFVTEISPDGSSILYSTYIGGHGKDGGVSIKVDKSGKVYVSGATRSSDFPVKKPYQRENVGGSDAFVFKLTPGGPLEFSTYIGGSDDEGIVRLALGKEGSVYVCGDTSSSDFPTQRAFQRENAGNGDAFVLRLKFNLRPVAKINAVHQYCGVPAKISLSSEGSYDPDGEITAYQWNLEEKPSGSSAFLMGKNKKEAKLFADKEGNYKVSLKVKDNEGTWSLASTHNISVSKGEPGKLTIKAERKQEAAWIIKKDYAHVEVSLKQPSGCYPMAQKIKVTRTSEWKGIVVYEAPVSQMKREGEWLKCEFYDKYLQGDETYTYRVEAYDKEGNFLYSAEAQI